MTFLFLFSCGLRMKINKISMEWNSQRNKNTQKAKMVAIGINYENTIKSKWIIAKGNLQLIFFRQKLICCATN